MKRLALILVLVGVGATASGQQAPPDTKGWHGAEWGMTKDQVTAATGFQLGEVMPGERTLGSGPDALSVECRPGGPTVIGDLSATSTFCFGTTGQHGLLKITLNMRTTTAFDDLRAELKSRYGDPTAEEDHAGSFASWKSARWLLPSSEVYLGWMLQPHEPDALFLTYSRRTAPVL